MDRLAEVYETFEDTWDIVVKESAAGDMLFASEEGVADKLDAAKQQQEDALEALEECRKNMDSAYWKWKKHTREPFCNEKAFVEPQVVT